MSCRLATLSACVLLSACGGATTNVDPQERFEAFRSDVIQAEREASALDGLSDTALRNMPTSGSARFAGKGAVVVEQAPLANPAPTILMLGGATMEANFARGTVAGQITDLRGIQPIGNTVFDVVEVGGRIDIGGVRSRIGDDPRTAAREAGNTWGADFSADLDYDGDSIRAAGPMTGVFEGNRVNAPGRSPMRGMTGAGGAIGTLDGRPVAMRVEVFADND